MQELQENDSDSEIFLDSVETDKHVSDWQVNVKILQKNVNMKLDTAAQCNVLPLYVYKQTRNKPLMRSKSRLVSCSGHKLETIGKATQLVSTKDKYILGSLYCQKQSSTFIWIKNLFETKVNFKTVQFKQ